MENIALKPEEVEKYTENEFRKIVSEEILSFYPTHYDRPDCPITKEERDPKKWLSNRNRSRKNVSYISNGRASSPKETLYSLKDIGKAVSATILQFRENLVGYDIFDGFYTCIHRVRKEGIGESIFSDEYIKQRVIGYYNLMPKEQNMIIEAKQLFSLWNALTKEGQDRISSYLSNKSKSCIVLKSGNDESTYIVKNLTQAAAKKLCTHLNKIKRDETTEYIME